MPPMPPPPPGGILSEGESFFEAITSSILRTIDATSVADCIAWVFTLSGSMTFCATMSETLLSRTFTPWLLPAFFVWAFGQFLVGHYFNDLLWESGFLSPLLILGLLVLSILAARASDSILRQAQDTRGVPGKAA